jgi:hypothetical protein
MTKIELSRDRTARARLMRKSTLDVAQEKFRAAPNKQNAAAYRDIALSYWEDEMIGDDSLLAALHEIKNT